MSAPHDSSDASHSFWLFVGSTGAPSSEEDREPRLSIPPLPSAGGQESQVLSEVQDMLEAHGP
jgi:hypothetical protein